MLTNVAEAMAKDGKQNEDLNKMIAIINDPEVLKNADEKEMEFLTSLALLAVIAESEERAAQQQRQITLPRGSCHRLYRQIHIAAAVSKNPLRMSITYIKKKKIHTVKPLQKFPQILILIQRMNQFFYPLC